MPTDTPKKLDKDPQLPYDRGMGNKLTWGGGRSSCHLIGMVRDGRPCDPAVIKEQIGKWGILAVSGGRTADLENKEGETVGIILPITSTRRLEVILDYNDTYIVRRIRYILKGKDAHTEVVEAEQSEIYCDQLAEVVLDLSTWK